jgi:hypothetical protein
MKSTRCAGIAVRVAAFYVAFAGLCQGIHAQSEIHFRLVRDSVIVVSLMANEKGPFDFVLDTGTNTTIVDPSLSRALDLVSLDQIRLGTFAGDQTVVRSSMRTLAAGAAHVENLEVLVQDLAELRKVDSHIEGIVGQNFLAHFNYLLDYRKHLVRIELANEIRDAIDGDQVKVEVSEDKMLVASEAQSLGHARLRLLLDSGANSVILIRKSFQAPDFSAQRGWLEVTSSGQVGLQVGRVRGLSIGSQQFHDLAVALSPAEPDDEERIEDGVLPTVLFRTLYVNNREGFVVFNPRNKKN